jgi:hypothetical protein
MADTIRVNYVSQVSIEETISGVFVSTRRGTVGIDGMNKSLVLDANSTPAVSKESAFQKALVNGAATIDLTSLPGIDGTAGQVNGTGLKVRIIKLHNPDTNANSIVATVGAANGYNLAGSTWKETIGPGEESLRLLADTVAPTIAANSKNLDLTGTGVQKLDVEIIMG